MASGERRGENEKKREQVSFQWYVYDLYVQGFGHKKKITTTTKKSL
jgi:hypothetical protein